MTTRTEHRQQRHAAARDEQSTERARAGDVAPGSAASSAAEERTRRRILDAASALLVRDPRASLADVAAAAGLGRTTVHRHYPTRDGLLDALALDAVARIEGALDSVGPDEGFVPDVLGRLLTVLLPLSDEFRLLENNEVWAVPALAQAWARVDARVGALIDRGKADGDLRRDLPTPLVVDAIAGLVFSVGCGITDGRVARRSAPADLLTLLLHGVTPG